MNDRTITFEPIGSIDHIYGAEPAGIVLRLMPKNSKSAITIMLPKDLVTGLRDMLNVALDEHLPPYHGAVTSIVNIKEIASEPGVYEVEVTMKHGGRAWQRMKAAELADLKKALAKRSN
jgi:hypothetical protein